MTKHVLTLSALIYCVVSSAIAENAREKRILIVGDSWAASITAENRDGFPAPDVFDDALVANGLGAFETQGKVTAWGGRKASDWAKPKHLDEIRAELRNYPTIDFVHLIIGGNDYLTAVNSGDFKARTKAERQAVWDAVGRDIQMIVDACLAVRDDIQVVIADYDYLDAAAAEKFWKMNFHGATVRELNTWFVELGDTKRAIATSTPRCEYLENWGTLQYWFGTPEKGVTIPCGDLDAPMPKGVSPDGIHPNAAAHAKLLQNVIDQFYKPWLTQP